MLGGLGLRCWEGVGWLVRVRSSGDGGKWIRKWIIDLGALPAPQGSGVVNAGRFDLALKAQGGVLCACDAWWRLVGSLWRFCGRVLKSAADGRRCRYYLPAACCLLPAA